MSVSFLKHTAGVVGFDIHEYWLFPAEPIENLHFVLDWELGSDLEDFSKRTVNVSAEGKCLLKGGATGIDAIHIPVPLPPSPWEAIVLTKLNLDSEVVAEMSAHKVTAEGGALATCVAGSFGIFRDCGEPLGVGFTIHPCSVQTRPTTGDYVGALAGWAAAVLLDKLGGLLPGGLIADIEKALLEELLRALGLDSVLDELPSSDTFHQFVQRAIDEGFDEALKQWREDVRKAKSERAETNEKRTAADRLSDFLKSLGMEETAPKNTRKNKRAR